VLLVLPALAAKGGECAKFTRKPTAVRDGGSVRIDFAVAGPTDAAVFIEDAKGGVVRHLAAGLLGKTPPRPFAPGLSQSINWDGRADYGKPAEGGPFKVRVALGLDAKYDRVVCGDPLSIGARALAVGPDGTLYVRAATGQNWPNGTGEILLAYGRDGKYKRQLMPFPADAEPGKLRGLRTVTLAGRPAPTVHNVATRDFYGTGGHWFKSSMAVTPDGTVLLPVAGPRLAALTPRGACAWGDFAGPNLLEKKLRLGARQRVFLAVSGDGRSAYVGGVAEKKGPKDTYRHAVYRVPLPARGPAKVFFGDPGATGRDRTHLAGPPRGLAVDGKGHLLVADQKGDRILVLAEKNGKVVAEIPAKAPDALAVDAKTGAVYVTCSTGGESMELVKLSGWRKPEPVARMELGKWGLARAQPIMALDAGASPAVIWMAAAFWRSSWLMRVEDRGGKFELTRVNNSRLGSAGFTDLSVDRLRGDIYFRAGGYWRFSETEDKLERFRFEPSRGRNGQLAAGYGGSVYLHHANPTGIYRLDRAGKSLAFGSGAGNGKGNVIPGVSPDMYVITSHQLGVRRDGHVFVQANHGKVLRRVRYMQHYGPNGKKVEDGPVWWTSEVAVGPKFDAAGNIYLAEQIKPKGQSCPPELGDVRGAASRYGGVASLYGSIVKFPPSGGVFSFGGKIVPPAGAPQARPAPGAATTECIYSWKSGRDLPCKVIGAEWVRMGVSHIEHSGCTCENTRFDVDEFGRVFYPDLCRFRVGVLDTAGNEITHFGGYGNADSAGPKSAVPEPEIALSWLVGVAVTDRCAYMGDTLARRLLRAKLVYAAEETCGVK
jgi:hypothetical protein